MSNILYVQVTHDPSLNRVDVHPKNLVLGAGDGHVVWWCADLPPGGDLRVLFPGSPSGPFQTLSPPGDLVIGSGNVGSSPPAPDDYPYQVQVKSPGADSFGDGVLRNDVEQPIPHQPTVHCVPNPSGPPYCYEDDQS